MTRTTEVNSNGTGNVFLDFMHDIYSGLEKLCCCGGNVDEPEDTSPRTITSSNPPLTEEPRRFGSSVRPTDRSKEEIPNTVNIEKIVYARPRGEPSTRTNSTPTVPDLEEIGQTDFVFQRFEHSATSFRNHANEHFQMKKHYLKMARKCTASGNRHQANLFFMKAKEQQKLSDEANVCATAAFLTENHEKNPRKDTIDLHHLYVKEAITVLDIFLDNEILDLKKDRRRSKFLMVITGRGKHSAKGVPRIKPAVIQRLQERNLKYSEVNAGLLRVTIFEISCLTADVREE